MDEDLLFELLEADNSESNTNRRRRRLFLREQSNPFELEEEEFIRRYRLSKQLALDLCSELGPMLKQCRRSTDVSVETKILTALSFYATGSYQRPTGDIGAHSLAQQTVSTVIAEVTACLNRTEIRNKYIIFPRTAQDRNNVRAAFFDKFGIPGVMGCIDCTHVAIVRPTEHEERYFCRKHYHSLNVQLICDANMQITSVDASFGGATHDSFIWNQHPIKTHLEGLNETTWLLGDSGYPIRKYMMTPIVNAIPDTPESYYTDLHVRTRNIVERTIGLLKARFRCLLVHRVLHYSPEVAASIVNACVILHNICNKANVHVQELSDSEMQREVQMQRSDEDSSSTNRANDDLRRGSDTRAALIRRLWQGRRT